MGSALLNAAPWILAGLVVWGAVRVVLEAMVIPPRHANPNTPDYFSEECLPVVADRDLGVWNRPSHHLTKRTRFAEGGMAGVGSSFARPVEMNLDRSLVRGVNSRPLYQRRRPLRVQAAFA